MHKPFRLDKGGRKFHAKRIFSALVVQGVVKANCCIERCFTGIHFAEPQSQWD